MAQHHHVARKRFGQHFLADESVIAAIVREIDPRPGDAMIEIGPGLGALTHALLDHGVALTVIELDRDLAARWRGQRSVTVIEGDVLKVDFPALAASEAFASRPLRLVGNLPYNISSPILFHLLPLADQVADQHFMLQKEVVERIVAAPGDAAYGRLSVMLQWRYHVESVLDVPPEAFEPPPRVDSAVVRLMPRRDAAAVDADLLSEVVQVAFSQRRKLLRHSLGRWLEARAESTTAGSPPPLIVGTAGSPPPLIGSTAGSPPPSFNLLRRAEEVPPQEFIALATQLMRGLTPR